MTDMMYFGMWENQLTGTLPTELFRMTNMVNFRVYENSMTGHLPTEIGLWAPKLTHLGKYSTCLLCSNQIDAS